MKRFVLGLSASLAALTMAPAANAGIFIGVSTNGGATITQVASDGGTGSANYNTTNGIGGLFYNVGATGYPLLTQPNLLTQAVSILTPTARIAAGTISIYITETDLASFNALLTSVFTSNTLSGATATISSYVSNANALWTGALLQNADFAGPGTFAQANLVNGTGPFSATVRYDITFDGPAGSNFNGTANLSAVPEPATWGMMLLGFGAMGGLLRTRRRPAMRIRYA